jgi:predicted  nucleic acid-binding Zn-ribbon protein
MPTMQEIETALLNFTMSTERLDIIYEKYINAAKRSKDTAPYKDAFTLALKDATTHQENIERLITEYKREAKGVDNKRNRMNALETKLENEDYNGCKKRLNSLNKKITNVLLDIFRKNYELTKLDEMENVAPQHKSKSPRITFFDKKNPGHVFGEESSQPPKPKR